MEHLNYYELFNRYVLKPPLYYNSLSGPTFHVYGLEGQKG